VDAEFILAMFGGEHLLRKIERRSAGCQRELGLLKLVNAVGHVKRYLLLSCCSE